MTQVGNTYAHGLYALAQEEGLEKEILDELNMLRGVFAENPEFPKLLASFSLPKQERCNVLDNSLRGKVQPYVLNFLKILTEKGYIRHFENCCRAYETLYNEEHGILLVHVASAVALSVAQQDKLLDKLSKLTGKTIQLRCSVDESCMGGVRLNYDGVQVDGTVQNRLDTIAKLLKNTVL